MFMYRRGRRYLSKCCCKGQIALVESGGDVTDEDKVNALRQAGAKGVLVYQNEEQGRYPSKIFPWGIGDPSILSVYLVILSGKS